jgi:hypothetical protein
MSEMFGGVDRPGAPQSVAPVAVRLIQGVATIASSLHGYDLNNPRMKLKSHKMISAKQATTPPEQKARPSSLSGPVTGAPVGARPPPLPVSCRVKVPSPVGKLAQ